MVNIVNNSIAEARHLKNRWKWRWRQKEHLSEERENSVNVRAITKLSLLIGVLLASAGIVYHQFQRHPHQEAKCKGTVPKSAEPASRRHPPDTEIPLPPSPSVLHLFDKAAVCSDSDVCSNIGRDILRRGGNAVDSALATLACNGLVTMQSMGMGGGFIMNVYQKSMNHSVTIIAREAAPSAVKMKDFSNHSHGESNLQGPISIAVPGELMGYYETHKRFASMAWKKIVQPTVELCARGFQLSKHQWDSLFFNPRIANDPHLRKMFVNATTGGYNRVGSLVRPPPELCETYRTLAENGPNDFYTGKVAKLVAEDLRDIGSLISLKDLEDYQVEVVDSIRMAIDENTLHLVPPVGSGAVVGLAMNILRGYDLRNKPPNTTFMHRIAETLKFAFAKRWDLGDPSFNDLKELLANLTSSEWAEQLRLRINDAATFSDPHHYGGQFGAVNEQGTGHISVLAPNGDAVSVTSTIHYYFGSAYMGKRTGILFNSAMGDFSIPGLQNYFSLPPSGANLVHPHKRPMSSMAPTIVTDLMGNPKLVVGGAGGPKIISALTNILVRVLWLGEDIKQAIDAPRFHHQLEPNAFEYEYGMLKNVIDGLEELGHKTLRYRERGSAFCGIMKNATAVYANVDFRKLGGVSGF